MSERFKHWRFRQRLARHGKKGVLKEFIDEAPIEQNFIRPPVKLTTEVGNSNCGCHGFQVISF